jgi:fatty-acyl-CoA synthase
MAAPPGLCTGAAVTNRPSSVTPVALTSPGDVFDAAPMRAGATPAQAWMRALDAVAKAAKDSTRTLPAIIGEAALRFGEAPALLSEDEEFSFRALAQRMNQYSRWAISRNIQPGDVVGLLMPNRPEYFAIWLGITQIGGVVALLNTNLAGGALAHCIDVASARGVIVARELAPAYASAAPHLRNAVEAWLHGEADLDAPRIDQQVETLDPRPFDRPDALQDDRALCIYTSGTTGLPKAANISHRRIVAWTCWFAALGDMGRDDRMYNCLPMYHSVGGIIAVASALMNGGSVFIARKFSAGRFWDDVARWDCTIFQYIGELCRYLVNAPGQPAMRAHRLRLACGNGMSADVWSAFQQRFAVPRILEFYAATESNFSLFNVEGKCGAVGKIPGFLKLRDPVALIRVCGGENVEERGADGFCIRCGVGEPGEAIGRIAVESGDLASRFEGYTDAAETEKKILRHVFKAGDAWMRTGDLMRFDEAGYYYFDDRLGDTFRWKGENVATQEVAAVLSVCPGVAEVAVYGVQVPGADGRAGMALLVARDSIDLADLARRLDALPVYAQPVFIRIARTLETTATFKHRKAQMVAEGYDPAAIQDPLYIYDRSAAAYVALDGARYAALRSGRMRL